MKRKGKKCNIPEKSFLRFPAPFVSSFLLSSCLTTEGEEQIKEGMKRVKGRKG